VLYFTPRISRFTRFMDFDMNWWGVYAMPVGVAICFGPVIIAWALAERRGKSTQSNRKEK
jgi:hypothetical protein